MATKEPIAILICPKCKKGYGINVRKDGTIRCRLCGYSGGLK